MTLYPCSICDKDCVSDTIWCSECKKWVHRTCSKLTKVDFQTWSGNSLKFVCSECACENGEFNHKAALGRLKHALDSKSKAMLTNQAKSEAKLLDTYHGHPVSPRPLDEDASFAIGPQHIDKNSENILKMFSPVMCDSYVPLITGGDGNCLYRAVSMGCYGHEGHHLVLRLLVAIELITNSAYYNKDRAKHKILRDNYVITSLISKLIRDSVVIGAFSEMAHLIALSSVLHAPIRSFYPPMRNTEFSNAFTKTVCGRTVSECDATVCEIMWSSQKNDFSLTKFEMDHFVTLVPRALLVDDTLDKSYANEIDDTCLDTPVEPAILDNTETVSEKSDINVGNLIGVTSSGKTCEQPVFDSTVVSGIPEPNDIESCELDPEASVEHHVLNSTVSNDPPEPSCNLNPSDVSYDGNILSDDSFDQQTNDEQIESPDSVEPANPFDMLEEGLHGRLDGNFLDAQQLHTLLSGVSNGLKSIPIGRKENIYFFLDNADNLTRRSRNERSVFSDDCGSWDSGTGSSPTQYYILDRDGKLNSILYRGDTYGKLRSVNRKRVFVPFDPQPDPNQVVVMRRFYTSLKFDKSYKKRVTWIEGGNSTAVVEYVGKFPGLGPLGDGSSVKEYIRVPDHVRGKINVLSSAKCKPTEILNQISKDVDVLQRPTSLNTVRQMVHRQKVKDQNSVGHSSNTADQIQQLENMVSEGHSFVQSIVRTNGRPPCIILYDESQLSDIKSMCCSGQTVLGVDKTFMLCKMHVTVTCYKHLSVVRHSTKEPPLFIGPMFIHDNSDYETYSHFFHHLQLKLADTDTSKFVVGTDDEKSLVKAIQASFPKSTHILCTRHLKQNAIHKLTDMAVDRKGRNEILDQVFGEDGIACADDTICFEEKCDDLESRCSEISEKFLGYFRHRLKPNLEQKVNIPYRQGLVGSSWTNNNCESINHVLKQAVNWKSQSLTAFVQIAQDLVKGQISNLRDALLGVGEFRLADSHSRFLVTKTQWINMTMTQKKNLFKRFQQHKQSRSNITKSSDGQALVVEPRTNGRKPGARKRKVNIKTTTLTVKLPKCA